MGEATKTLIPQAPAAAEAGLSAGSTATASVGGLAVAGVAAGADGAAVLHPASAKQIPNQHDNLALGMMGRDYADLASSFKKGR
jgi:hypothetical protein